MATVQRLEVDEAGEGKTLAALLRGLHPELSWNQVRRLIRSGRVEIDGQACYEDAQRLRAGQVIQSSPGAPSQRAPTLADADILHMDSDIVVVRKPAGLVTAPFKAGAQARRPDQAREEQDTLVHRTALALDRGPAKRGRGQRSSNAIQGTSLGVVQRLDRGTTGLLVFARNRRARQQLEQQFRKHEVERRYLALVHGNPQDGEVTSFLVADRGDGKRGSWRGSGAKPPRNARYAKTTVYCEESLGDFSLVSCELATGRQHQIRIHLSESGHSLVGETVYGPLRLREGSAARDPRISAADRPMLHAHTLGLRHPTTGQFMGFEDPIPDDFANVLAALRSAPPRSSDESSHS